MRRRVLAFFFLILGGCGGEVPPEPQVGITEVAPECRTISVHCGATPTLAFDAEGQLWAAFEHEGHVYVTASQDRGASFAIPSRVNEEAETIETNGENRPKVAVAASGPIYVSWTRKLEGQFKGDIRFSRSLDGGRTFEPPRTVNDDGLEIGHRFESLHVDEAGDVYLAWIDKRDLEAAKARGEDYVGAAVYYAVSTDQGASFAPNRKVADHACECCRIGIAGGESGGAALLWRHVFGANVRDHAFATLAAGGVASPLLRPSEDRWQLDGCPHHGPALAAARESGYHLAWFTGAADRPGVHYGRFHPESGELEHQALVAPGPASHPHVVEAGGRLLLAWKEFRDGLTHVYLRESADGGAAWGEARSVASTDGASDHPFLLASGGESFLSWHTEAEGLRVLPLGK
jgi:hypothetical protein